MKRQLTGIAVALLTIIVFAATSRAESVVITFSNAAQFGQPGETVSFSGSLLNTTSSVVTVNAVRFSNPFLPGLPPSVGLPAAPVSSIGLPLLASGSIRLEPLQGTGNVVLFSLVLNDTFVGEFTRTFLVGTLTPNGIAELGRANFVFTVAPQPIPEPASLTLLLSAGLAAGTLRARGRRRKND